MSRVVRGLTGMTPSVFLRSEPTALATAFRIATDPRKLVLAAAAVALFWCGDQGMKLLPFGSSSSVAKAPPFVIAL